MCVGGGGMVGVRLECAEDLAATTRPGHRADELIQIRMPAGAYPIIAP